MKKHLLGIALMHAIAAATLAPVHAQDTAAGPSDKSTPTEVDRVVVKGEIVYRDRVDSTAPALTYDLEYFQRFEPSTVGDMLKRVPSAVFVSDVLEYDGVQLRGLDPGYTQVLINGKKVPGAGDDRSFWVDRIPAEMVDHIEILRSNSANRSGDAVAGALNIVLRDAWQFDGSYIRVGAIRYDDGKTQPTFGAVTSFEALGGRLLAGINVQDRYNPKQKRSDRWDDPGMEDFDSAEDQADTRDGQDYSGNLSYVADVGETGRLSLDGFYVKTDRTQTEVSTEYDAPTLADAEEVANVPGFADVDQNNWGVGLEYKFDMAGGRTEFGFDHARFEDNSSETEEEHVYDEGEWDGSEAEAAFIDSKDSEASFKLAHKRPAGAAEMEFGVDYRRKQRDIGYTTAKWEAEDEGDPVDYTAEYSVVDSTIEEIRIDPYLMFSGKGGAFAWEAGLRYETTKSDMDYNIADFEDGELDDEDGDSASKNYKMLLPSAHFKWNLSDADRVTLSLARSVKRPSFHDITPVTWEGEFGDNDLRGNPQLNPETANGLDLGIEHRIGARGVVGVNVFYRDVKNLIEVVNTGDYSDEYEGQVEDFEEWLEENPGATQGDIEEYIDDEMDAPTYVYTSRNVGDGKVWGVEFDLSTPLIALGLPNTGVFLNYSWLDSKVTDFIGERRFNNQARSVYNVGFIQDLPDWKASFGASYRKQGDAFSRMLAEEITTTYGADLEVFVEKRFGDSVSVRLSGTNLLDAYKYEYFDKFNNEADQIDRDFDEYEIEAEHAGPRYQLVVRWAF